MQEQEDDHTLQLIYMNSARSIWLINTRTIKLKLRFRALLRLTISILVEETESFLKLSNLFFT